jgi:hypothetical protein
MQKKTSQEVLEEFVKTHFLFFKEIYSSEGEMLEYGLKFKQMFKSFDRAFNEFYSISEFYRALKLIGSNDDAKSETVADLFKPQKNRVDFIKLIMIISLIEKLSSGRDFIEFSEWIKLNKLKNEKVLRAWNTYNKEHGCSHKFRNFFQNEDYLTKREQLALLRSVSYYVRNKDNSLTDVPLFCYDAPKCGKRRFGCKSVADEECTALKEEKVLKDGIKEFANFLYVMRNRFVHDANMISLSEEFRGEASFLYDYVPYKLRYLKRPSYNGFVGLKLSAQSLENILNRNFKKLLNNYIKIRNANKNTRNLH